MGHCYLTESPSHRTGYRNLLARLVLASAHTLTLSHVLTDTVTVTLPVGSVAVAVVYYHVTTQCSRIQTTE